VAALVTRAVDETEVHQPAWDELEIHRKPKVDLT